MRQIIFLDEATKMNKLIAAGKLDQSKLTPMERAQFQAYQYGKNAVSQTAADAHHYQKQAAVTTGEAQAANKTLSQFNTDVKNNQIKYGRELKHGNPHDVNNLAPRSAVNGTNATERTRNRVQHINTQQDKVESQPGHSIIDRRTGGKEGYARRIDQYNKTVDARQAADQLTGKAGPAWKYSKMSAPGT